MQLCGFEVGIDRPFFLIAGPCAIESERWPWTPRPAQDHNRQSRHLLYLQIVF